MIFPKTAKKIFSLILIYVYVQIKKQKNFLKNLNAKNIFIKEI